MRTIAQVGNRRSRSGVPGVAELPASRLPASSVVASSYRFPDFHLNLLCAFSRRFPGADPDRMIRSGEGTSPLF